MALAYFAEQILYWRLRIRKNQGRGAGTLNAHLVLFGTGRDAFLFFDNERTEFIAINLRKHDEDVGKAAISDKHLLAIEDVVRAVCAKPRRCFRRHGVGT